MRSLQDRIWLVLLGVAVAILVTLTTIYWNVPKTARDPNAVPGKSTPTRTLLPKIGSSIIQLITSPASSR